MKSIKLAAIFLTVPYVAVFRTMQYVQDLEYLFLRRSASITTKKPTERTSNKHRHEQHRHVLPLAWDAHSHRQQSSASAAVSPPQPQPASRPASRKRENISYNNTVWAFLRIPKTGSTSMMAYLENYSQMQSLYHAIPGDSEELRNQPRNVLPCMFVDGTTNIFKNSNSSTIVTNPDDAICGHLGYRQHQQVWNEVGSKHVAVPSSTDDAPPRMQTFTLIREPLDQLRSTFGMMQSYYNTTHWGRDISTPEQYAKVAQGDWDGWLELLHTQQQQQRATLFQFQFLAPSATEAIQMITTTTTTTGDSGEQDINDEPPMVIALLNECFEASLRLLEKQYSFPQSGIDQFLHSGEFHSRKTSTTIANNSKTNAAEQQLREKAKVWFANEYRFYDAAVKQFRHQWWSSGGVDSSILRNPCHVLLG